MGKGVAFFENGSWYHRTKELNEDYTVKYSKKGGFATEKEAEESYNEYEERFEKASSGKLLKIDDNLTIKNYLIYWYENIFVQRIESTTKMISAYTLYSLVIPNINIDIKLKLLTAEYINDLLKRIEGMSSIACAKKSREILNIALKDAISDKRITFNPMEEVKQYFTQRKKIIILSKKELKLLLSIASQDNWYLEVLLGLFCGLRKGEIEGLKFSDFNIEEKTVTISRQIVAEYEFENDMEKKGFKIKDYTLAERDPKTINSFRKLRVPEIIIKQLQNRKQLIEYYKSRYEDFEDNDYISCQQNGKPHGLCSFNSYLKRTCKKIGLPHITVHGLRHMYATILIEQGVPLVKISGLLGHDSIHTTFEYYCDIMEEDKNINAFMNNTFVVQH